MKTCVLDSSALLRFFLADGPLPDELENTMVQALEGSVVLLAPELLLLECGQTLLKKVRAGLLSLPESEEVMSAILELPVEYVPHGNLVRKALEHGHASGLSVYDGAFLALALERRAVLLTADDALQKAWKKLRGKKP